jgi:hypothetical protein
MSSTCCPSLYQINTRVWLTAFSRHLGRPANAVGLSVILFSDAHFERDGNDLKSRGGFVNVPPGGATPSSLRLVDHE